MSSADRPAAPDEPARTPDEPARTPDEVSAAMHAQDRVAQAWEMEVEHAAVGSASVSMTVTEHLCNGLGVCHGGVVFTLADTAMAHASNAGGERTLSTTASIEWIRAARVGDRLTATSATVDHRGRNTIHDIDVVDQRGQRVALVRGQTLTLGGDVAP
ncbi:MAG: hotdog fold thioesterase [Actinomycetota bacterium]